MPPSPIMVLLKIHHDPDMNGRGREHKCKMFARSLVNVIRR